MNKETIWTPAFRKLFVMNLVLNLGMYMVNALVPKYANSLGVSSSLVGLVSGAFAVSALLIRPVAGPAFDSFSKKKLLMIAILFNVGAFTGYGLSSSIGALIVARLFHGIGVGVCLPLCLSLASESLPEDRIASGIGIFSLGQALASAIGPSLGLYLIKAINYRFAFFLGDGLVALAFFLASRLEEKKDPHYEQFRISFDRIVEKSAIVPSIFLSLMATAYSCINAFMAIYGDARGVEQIGLYFTVYAVSLLAVRPLSGMVTDKLGLDKCIIPSVICFMLSFLLISFSTNLWMFLFSAAIAAFGYGASQPSLQAFSMKMVPGNRRGAGANTNYIGTDIGNLLGPVIAGFVIDFASAGTANAAEAYATMYRVMCIPLILTLVLFIPYYYGQGKKAGKKAGNEA